MANGWGGKRAGGGRPKGSPGLKSEALAARLDALDYDPAETLVRLGQKAEAAGETELAIKAAVALMSFRWPKLKEAGLDIGLSGSLADRLQDAQARLTISVVTGVPRPPDDPIEAAPVPTPVSSPPSSPEPPEPQASPSPVTSPPKPPSEKPTPRPTAPPPPPEPPLLRPGQPVKAHDYWTQRKPEVPSASTNTDYDPWKL
jgi:hypothetical protein